MTKYTSDPTARGPRLFTRCRHCRQVLSIRPGPGRPKEFCGGACRQRDWIARQRADQLRLSDEELIVTRKYLDELYDDIYVISCTVQDIECDGIIEASTDPMDLQEAFQRLLDAVRPLLEPDRLSTLRP